MPWSGRRDCPQCGMGMIVTSSFNQQSAKTLHECLRCGHIDSPKSLQSAFSKETSAENHVDRAKRYRDKANEAEQLAEHAKTQGRRATLLKVASYYRRTADQVEQLSDSDARPASSDRGIGSR